MKFFTFSVLITLSMSVFAQWQPQNRQRMDDVYSNPYENPNYYPSDNYNYNYYPPAQACPPPRPIIHSAPVYIQPIVNFPPRAYFYGPSYCRPVMIAPAPVVYRHHGYHHRRGHSRRW